MRCTHPDFGGHHAVALVAEVLVAEVLVAEVLADERQEILDQGAL